MLTINSVFIVALVALLCRDPASAVRGLFCVWGAVAIGSLGIAVLCALAVLPGVAVGSLAGYIGQDTARSWALLAICVLTIPAALWMLALVARELRPVVAVLASRHGMHALLAGGTLAGSVWNMSPICAAVLGAAVPSVWALRKSGIYDAPLYKPEPLPSPSEAE